ncbi:Asp23/Gls24 family envelope stress response protein [Clostridium perfringens]|uniref:Asp23/Gls24 family envelope stress response protein n=1 Tax=Clostridium perfringens TaxID=1502 RepID=UPI0024BCB76C|nr:Asp23/Gls24 family envelope stress response protein [Clostridium perfringens]MDU2092028.1 Asp23/Gls24 family envelope stress response protein [Clostridium perfringens]MDU2225406.1 Asp23/Gls24 family envelope stress response protein [Clostridium perfringens]
MNEMNRDEANLGIVNISDEVIGVVAGIAASEIDGILEINHNNSTRIGHKFSKKSLGKGIKVNVENGEAVIEIGVTVQYGIKIPDVVSQVQENVRRTVEAITGLKVALVNIYVQNIIILKEEDKNEILKK